MIALQSNLGLKILALFLSIFLWGFVKFTQTPFSSTITQADVRVPVEVLTDADMTAMVDTQDVTITVRGSDDAIRNLKPNSITARVNLQGAHEGFILPPVSVNQPADITVISVQPERFSVRLEPNVTQDLPVVIKLMGRVAAGYKTETPVVSPASAKVSGPKSLVQQVTRIVAPLKIEALDISLLEKVTLEPMDEKGNLVHRVEIVPRNANVSVQILPDVVPRMLPVFPRFRGALRPHLRLQEAQYSPRMVPVIFVRQQASHPTVLYTEPVSLSGLDAGEHRATARIQLPSDAKLVKDKEVQMTLVIRAAGGGPTPQGKKP